jgi:tetratricopeptide (TPR) repeat protein
MLKLLAFVVIGVLLTIPAIAAAPPPLSQATQSSDEAPGKSTSPEAERDGDEIVVPGVKPPRLWIEGLEAFRSGRYAEAEEKLHTLELRVETESRFEALLIGDYVSDFIFTVDRIPDEGAAIVYVRGIAQARQGKLDLALGAMRETMRIDSKFFDAYADLALIQVLRGRPDLARRQLKPMAKLISKCDYNCAEKQARYERVRELAADGADSKQ